MSEQTEKPAAPKKATAPKKTAEQWAVDKGLLPQSETTKDGRGVVRTKHNPEYWKFAAARAFKAWPTGAEVTEAEFDAAVTEATTQTYR